MLDRIRLMLQVKDTKLLYSSIENISKSATDNIINVGKVKVIQTNSNYLIAKIYKIPYKEVFIIRERDIEFIGVKQEYDITTGPISNIKRSVHSSEIGNCIGRCEIFRLADISDQDSFIDFIDGGNFIIQLGTGDNANTALAIEENDIMRIYLIKDNSYKEVDLSILNIY